MTKQKRFTVKSELYSHTLFVACGGSIYEAQDAWIRKYPYIERMNKEDLERMSNRVGCFCGTSTNVHMIYFYQKKPGCGVTVHETFHAVYHILKSAGVRLSDESEEAFTYLLEDLVKKIVCKL